MDKILTGNVDVSDFELFSLIGFVYLRIESNERDNNNNLFNKRYTELVKQAYFSLGGDYQPKKGKEIDLQHLISMGSLRIKEDLEKQLFTEVGGWLVPTSLVHISVIVASYQL